DVNEPSAAIKTTLSAAMTNVQLTASVGSTTGFPATGTLVIDTEYLNYTGTTANSFTGLTRGVLGSTAAAHANGATVALYGSGAVWATSSNGAQSVAKNEFCYTNWNAASKLYDMSGNLSEWTSK